MIQRKQHLKQLNLAVSERYRVILITGIPRVGRSNFLSQWKNHRDDVKTCRTIKDIEFGSGIFVLDHVDKQIADEVVSMVRSDAFNQSNTKVVIVPNDLVSEKHLSGTLAGITKSVEITPFRPDEIPAIEATLSVPSGPMDIAPISSIPDNKPAADPSKLWIRGGLPESFQSESDADSLNWRQNMLKAVLARDYTDWGIDRAFPLFKALEWIASLNGSELDESKCPLGKRQEIKSAIYILELLGLIRRLPSDRNPLDRKQKIYIRDTGILHALLGIESWSRLRQSDIHIGGSFESYAIEALIAAGGERCYASFYREKGNKGEEEIDLILRFSSQDNLLLAIEFKVGQNQEAKRGFHYGCAELGVETDHRFVVHSGDRPIIDEGVPPEKLVPRLDLASAVERVRICASS